MIHYVCPRCGGVADVPKVCETDGCEMNGQDLKECNCLDGKHTGVVEEGSPAAE